MWRGLSEDSAEACSATGVEDLRRIAEPKALETVERLATAEGTSMYSVVSNPHLYAPLEKPAAKLLQFHKMMDGLEQLLVDNMPLPEFYDELMLRTGYAQMLQDKPTEENKTRLENIKELKSSILSYVQNAIDPSLAGFLEEIALYTDIEQYDAGADAAVMMTIHSAKGLEFDHVFLVGFEDGLFPGLRSIGDPEEMEEERRLCYVANTRAKKNLTICYAKQRMIYGRTAAALSSRFLKEIPESCIFHKILQAGTFFPCYTVKVEKVRNIDGLYTEEYEKDFVEKIKKIAEKYDFESISNVR